MNYIRRSVFPFFKQENWDEETIITLWKLELTDFRYDNLQRKEKIKYNKTNSSNLNYNIKYNLK
jgi:hypothetical protein